MTDHTSLLAASFPRSPKDTHSTTVTAVHCPGGIAVTRHTATDIVVRSALSQVDQCRILALPYPVGNQVFWQLLAEVGVTQERLMDRMGASP